MTQGELVVAERRKLHRVLEETRPSSEARTGEIRGPRVVECQTSPDAFEVEPPVIGHHVELVGGGELDVAPAIGEQLGQLGLFWLQRNKRAGKPPEECFSSLLPPVGA